MTFEIDRDFNDLIYSPVCLPCKHMIDVNKKTCKAFPQGVPKKIWNGDNDHKKSYLGDHGIQFEPRKPQE